MSDDLTVILSLLSRTENQKQLEELIEILHNFKKVSGLAINLGKTNLVPSGKFLEPEIMELVDHIKIKRADDFKLLGISFNNKLKGMEKNYRKQIKMMRKEMFAWYKICLSNKEKAMVVKTHVAMILEKPPKKMVEEIETMIRRFIQAGSYRTTREQIFLPKDMGRLGIPHV